MLIVFFFQAEDGIRDYKVTGVQTCALPICLADSGAAEQADLAALGERHQQVDDLDARDEQVLAAGLLLKRRRRAMNRQIFAGFHRSAVVLRRSEEHTSELQSPCNLVCRLLLEKKKQTLTRTQSSS